MTDELVINKIAEQFNGVKRNSLRSNHNTTKKVKLIVVIKHQQTYYETQ